MLKLLNIMDPLLPSNNLGRSVARASFVRIRRTFAYGAAQLRQILEEVGLTGWLELGSTALGSAVECIASVGACHMCKLHYAAIALLAYAARPPISPFPCSRTQNKSLTCLDGP